MMKSFRKLLVAAAFAAIVAGTAAEAQAGSTTANLAPSATIGATCTISNSGSPGSSWTYDPVVTNATTAFTTSTTLTYSCTSGTTPTGLTMDQGTNPASGSTAAAPARQMKNGTNMLAYNIFSSAANQTTGTAAVAWGTANEPTMVAGTGSNQTFTIYFKIPAGQNTLPAGTYTDTVVETLSF